MKYIGIDGGGTKTSFCLTDESFHILSEYQTTGCYYPNVGKTGIIEVLREGIQVCLNSAGIGVKDVISYCGLPAYGELDKLMADLPEIAEQLPVPVKFCNDSEVCHAGALGGSPGITIIAGTGSIAFGRDETGSPARSGGFGSEMNCDEGSAHFIGLRLIQKFTRQSDLREDRTLLYDEVKKELGLKNDIDIYEYMTEIKKMDRRYIAGLAVTVDKIARLGDTACRDIFLEAAHELYLLASALKKQLNFTGLPVKVSYAGGVFKAGGLILPELKNLLEKNDMLLENPKYPPVIGACILAKNNK
jgi:N-acetylglucosamine kinase-like BadF-type ATPase